MPDQEWWRAEARRCAEDGHPYAAIAAMANALVGEHLARDAAAFRAAAPREWAQLSAYADALGVELPG